MLNHHFFLNNENTYTETETKLDFISSNWDDDNMMRLDENNWQCLWCNKLLQVINSNKAFARVLGKKGMNIKNCYVFKGDSI